MRAQAAPVKGMPPAGALRLQDGRDRRRVAVGGWLRTPSRPPSTRTSRAGRPRGRKPGLTRRRAALFVAAPGPARSTGTRVDGRRDGVGFRVLGRIIGT